MFPIALQLKIIKIDGKALYSPVPNLWRTTYSFCFLNYSNRSRNVCFIFARARKMASIETNIDAKVTSGCCMSSYSCKLWIWPAPSQKRASEKVLWILISFIRLTSSTWHIQLVCSSLTSPTLSVGYCKLTPLVLNTGRYDRLRLEQHLSAHKHTHTDCVPYLPGWVQCVCELMYW